MSVTVLGIDPSLNSTGLCWGYGPNDRNTDRLHYSPETGETKTVIGRVNRLNNLTFQLEEFLDYNKPDYVMIEQYAYSKTNGGEHLAEFGGILRCRLADITDQIVEVGPTQLKKFALGKSSGKKEQILMNVYKRWGVECETSDEADAYVLYRIGLCYAGICEPENQAQREVLAKLKGGT